MQPTQQSMYTRKRSKERKTLIFAHRGANNEAAENTRSAFERALQYPIDGIETDIQLSKDEVTVLWHDRFLGRLGYPAKHIDDFDYTQLQEMNAAAHFFTTHQINSGQTESIMTLAAFLAAYRRRTRLLLEIKNRNWEATARHHLKIQQTLAGVGEIRNEEIFMSSFNLNSLIYAHQLRPEFPLIYNLEEYQTVADMRAVLAGQPFLQGLCLPIANLSGDVVQLLREQEKNITVYTCNSDEEINQALRWEVDILISDLPEKSLKMRDAQKHNEA
ncbi:MAG: glycerophosphodiester phosphodiesterase [Candidatus Nitrotoga sp.]